jgi:hypothetical protein
MKNLHSLLSIRIVLSDPKKDKECANVLKTTQYKKTKHEEVLVFRLQILAKVADI